MPDSADNVATATTQQDGNTDSGNGRSATDRSSARSTRPERQSLTDQLRHAAGDNQRAGAVNTGDTVAATPARPDWLPEGIDSLDAFGALFKDLIQPFGGLDGTRQALANMRQLTEWYHASPENAKAYDALVASQQQPPASHIQQPGTQDDELSFIDQLSDPNIMAQILAYEQQQQLINRLKEQGVDLDGIDQPSIPEHVAKARQRQEQWARSFLNDPRQAVTRIIEPLINSRFNELARNFNNYVQYAERTRLQQTYGQAWSGLDKSTLDDYHAGKFGPVGLEDTIKNAITADTARKAHQQQAVGSTDKQKQKHDRSDGPGSEGGGGAGVNLNGKNSLSLALRKAAGKNAKR